MCENPYQNEPGYESQKATPDALKYADKIVHESLRLSICDRLEGYVKRIATPASQCHPGGAEFEDISKRLFLCHYDRYLQVIQAEHQKHKDGEAFPKASFESTCNGMSGSYDYTSLERRIRAIHDQLHEETAMWELESKQWRSSAVTTHASLERQWEQACAQPDFANLLDVRLAADSKDTTKNPFVWNITLFGMTGTPYEGGVFQLTMHFHRDFPAVAPRLRFHTPLFHPHITATDGIPYYVVPKVKQHSAEEHLRALLMLFSADPSPQPSTHVNPEASRMCFSAVEKERKEYARRVRRCCEDSLS